MTGALPTRFAFFAFEVDESQRRLRGPGGETIPLRPRVFDTLMVLVRRAGETVAKDEILATVWADTVVEENNLNQAISSLRQALGDDRRNPRFIATIPGRGYQFIAPVTVLPASDAARQNEPGGTSLGADRSAAAGASGANRRRQAVLIVLAAALAAVALGWLLGPWGRSAPLGLDDARLVTNLPVIQRTPTLSPDGTLIAYVSDRSGTDQLWLRGLPDGNPLQLTHGDQPAAAPSWSPVDQNILFERKDEDGLPAIWVVDALGATAPRVVQRNASYPRFAPDGRSFTFVRGLLEIHVGSLDSAPARRLPVPETVGFAPPMPAMNARGDVAFVLADEGPSGDLWLYDAAAQRSRRLTASKTAVAGVWARSPVWLPDQRSVIYAASEDDPSNTHLYRVDVKTGRRARLSTGVGGYGDPAVSRDGTRLAYAYARPVSRLVRTDPRTGEERVLHSTRSLVALPTVSPDGRTVAWFGEHVFTLDVDGGEVVQWTFDDAGVATLPSWSRSDGSHYFYRGRALHRLVKPGQSERVLEDFHWSSKKWLAVHGNRLAYRERKLLPGSARTVIHDLATGDRRILEASVLPTDWSRDGRLLLGRVHPGADLLICAAPTFACEPILHDGEPVRGARPRWSADEQRVLFRRARPDRPGYAWIWSVDREGGEPERLVEIGPYEPQGMFFGVAHDGTLIWNEYERFGGSEVWFVDWSEHARAP